MSACFSAITMLSLSLHVSVQRPVQIVSMMPGMPPPMISAVNVAATHAGGPMQGAILLLLAVMHW
jgi:hypothetical protein